LLSPPPRRWQPGRHSPITEPEAAQLQANVKALLDNDQPAEAIRLLEDGVERAGHDPFVQLRLRHFLAAALFYAGEYTRAAPLFDVVGRDYRQYLAPSDAFVLDSSYHAGHAYAEIGEPDKALPQLRFYVHHASAAGDEEADKVLGARFALAQMLAAAGRADDALAELESLRPLLAVSFGADSTQVRNLDKHSDRLGSLKEHSLSRGDNELGR
jgi:tetratricopeptide (TPR) repeat protein